MRNWRFCVLMAPKFSKLLITGGSGFLGWNLARQASECYEVFFTYGQHPIRVADCQAYHMNLQDRQHIEEVIEEIEPEVIIHTAALANADLCEKRRPLAYEVNVAATAHLAQCAEDFDCRLLYISTDLVFDGRRGDYAETDLPHPLSYYGESKLRGEEAVRTNHTNYLIIRTALMYGQGNGTHGSFLEWMQHSLQRQEPLSLFTDQYRTPLFVNDAVQALLEIMELPVQNEVYHLGGRQRVNRYEFGETLVKIFGYEPTLLRPVRMQDVSSLAVRGADCSLNSEKIQRFLSFQLSDVTTGLQRLYSITA